MEKAGIEPLPFEQDNMCPMIAAFVLNKKGYEIPIPQANCRLGIFYGLIHGALGASGLHMQLYEKEKLVTGKMKLVKKQNDGLLLLISKSNPDIFHFIAFIVQQGSELTFYDPEAGNLHLYRLKDYATANDFDNDFRDLFPNEEIVQVSLFEPNVGGKRRTRKNKKSRRKTRKRRR